MDNKELAKYLREVRAERLSIEREVADMEAKRRVSDIIQMVLGAEVRVAGPDDYLDVLWALVEDVLKDHPEAREALRLKLEEMREQPDDPGS